MPNRASWRRWNEQLAWLSPTISAHLAAVAVPSTLNVSMSAHLMGCASARKLASSTTSPGAGSSPVFPIPKAFFGIVDLSKFALVSSLGQ
jgi:hypothetical protein